MAIGGCTVAELQQRMTQREYWWWRAYNIKNPIGAQRVDYQNAHLIQSVHTFFYMFLSKAPPKTKVSDFLLKFKIPDNEQDIQEKMDRLFDTLWQNYN